MGVDVYSGDGKVDWKQVRSAGHSFGICKATEGANHRDSQFITNMKGLKAAGMVRGAYHFYRVGQMPTVQAALFLDTMNAAGYDYKTDLPPCLDIEDREGASQLTRAVLRHDVSLFLEAVEKVTGRLCIIYLDYDFGQNILGEGYGGHPLWIASLQSTPKIPSGWKDWKFHQYSWEATIPGIPRPGGVDVNHYAGTEAQLRAWATQTSKPK